MSCERRKCEWRARLLAARAELAPDRLTTAAGMVERVVLDQLAGATWIAAYVPVGREPGSVALLDALRHSGTGILLPVVRSDGLAWAPYTGLEGLVGGALGTREPGGPQGALGVVDAVLVPALAVDHRGVRLGRGGGYYDRALVAVPDGTPLVALLHDGELVARLPADPWDRPVTAVVSPARGWTELPVVEHDDG